ncbi:hypothetical protein ATANTOWER_009228, partial [Ataeniobius toweri]|nr:hypothetical protein [Ataeniobius toweri]
FDDKYGECCLKTAVRLLGSVCCWFKEPGRCDVPLQFLELVCWISKIYSQTDSETRKRTQQESFGETLHIITEWRRNTFNNKLLHAWNRSFSSPIEINVWTKLLSVSFSHEEQTSFWRSTFLKDFEGKLKQEDRVHQIGIYSKMMEELSDEGPLLCIIEKCALEAVAYICQDKSGRAMKKLLENHNITKFGKLMSVVVLKSWPSDANGDHAEDQDLIFQYLLDWHMAKTVFQMAGAGGDLINKLSDEAQYRMTLGASVFKSVSEKFLNGQIKMKTLNQILQREQNFLGLLKIDALCDDGRCKDESKMRRFLRIRREEAEAASTENELIRGLLQICREVPEHVSVDFQGLEKKLQPNFDLMNLNEFMKVCTLDELSSQSSRKVTYSNLSDAIYEMASELHAIKDSLIFKMCWTNQVQELSREDTDEDDTENSKEMKEIYTLDHVHSKIYQSCYSRYKELYSSLKSGEMLLEEVDIVFEVYIGKHEDLHKDLDIMCRIDPSDDRKWIKGRIAQIREYHDHHLVMDSAKIIMDIRSALCPEGDFSIMENLLQMNEVKSKTNNLNCIDKAFVSAKNILKDVTDQRKECLRVLSQSENFIKWVKRELKDINELKVFVDLASISAGENDQDVDRVAFFHDAVLGYSSLLYGLKQNSGFKNVMDSLPALWKALGNDKDLPKKLRDTARHLEWLKTVRETHGSVEFSSLSLATSINERGMYTIRAQNQKRLNLETSLTLQIQDGQGQSLTHTYEDLKELQNKLMLMSGKKQQNQSEVEQFTEVFENVQRLAKAFVDLHTAGNPLFRCWEAKIYCKSQSDQCINMEINFCKTIPIKINGSLIEQLVALSRKMELFFGDWQKFMDEVRSDHYYLNFFTAEQIFSLCSVLSPANVNTEIDEQALMMLSFIKANCSTSDVWRLWQRLSSQYERGNIHIEKKDKYSACISHFTHAENGDQTVGLRELEDLWLNYIRNERMFFHDLLDIRSLGHLFNMMTDPEYQNENESDSPVLSQKRDDSLRRDLPKGLIPKQPNLLICPHDQVLTSSICLYMNSEYQPLPSYDEVLLCTPSTSYEQVELFLRRCLTPGNIGQKVYTMIWADQLTYDVSCAMEKCFQKLSTLFNRHDYRLVIYCSSERDHTYIPTAFSQFKRDFVPQEPLGKIQKYLSRHFSSPSYLKDAMFKGGHNVGIVSSHRAGVGKSLYVQRMYEKLERCVEQGTAHKKCIRLTEHDINDHQVLQSLYDTPKQKDIKVFHLDVTSVVQKGLDEFLFKLFFLRYLMDSDGQMWHCTHKHLYIMELTETTNDQARFRTRLLVVRAIAIWPEGQHDASAPASAGGQPNASVSTPTPGSTEGPAGASAPAFAEDQSDFPVPVPEELKDESPPLPVPVREGFQNNPSSFPDPVPVPEGFEDELPPLLVPVRERFEVEPPPLPVPVPEGPSGSCTALQSSTVVLTSTVVPSLQSSTAVFLVVDLMIVVSEGPLHARAGLLTSFVMGSPGSAAGLLTSFFVGFLGPAAGFLNSMSTGDNLTAVHLNLVSAWDYLAVVLLNSVPLRVDLRVGQKENFAFPDVFPKVFCRPPKEVMALEIQKDENFSTENDDPLMDDECFRSEAFQRPYQYLSRFHNNNNLDNFTYKGIEGTHSNCLQIFLFYCGVLDPSWAELRNFVWFLDLQLQDCENSVFCNVEFVGDTLQGFKNFVVEFMILMSKDFATPSLCITDESLGKKQADLNGINEKDLAPFLIRKRWESEPHPYIFFNEDHTSMTFIGFHLKLNDQKGVDAINPSTGKVIKENIMTQELYRGLRHQRVPFNVDFDQLPRADKIEHLCSVLGIKWPTDPDETYELTTDNILKMMAIHMRFRCGIPVIIMGETGCGKTRLVKFMCELRRCGAPAENMKLVKVHGGTTSKMIHDKVIEAETLAKTNKENHEFDSVLFFDEANTTEAISSIKEIICDHSVQGKSLASQTGLQIIAACNPYRKHTNEMIERLEASGLGYRVHARETQEKLGSIPLRQLVYRVHVLPPSLIPLVWDFGQLSDSTEQMYIQQIVQRQAKASLIEERHIPLISNVLSSSQKFMRKKKDECSFVSLRDVERCVQVFVWFHRNHSMFAENLKDLMRQQTKRRKNLNFSPASDRVIWSLLMATGVCYQSCLESKDEYQKTISQLLSSEYKPQRIQQEIKLMQDLLLSGVPLGKTIARNEALKENFFMMAVCIELRIPLFIVGKPGSSKSLSKTLVADAMQGPTSHSDLFKRLKQIHLVSFQCSPHSTPEGIIHTFKQCARFQESKNLDEYISVVVLDEIGLAEDSPKMPLKTLHPLLEEGCVDEKPQPHQRVGFIGISNWALDPAKMNRGIFVSRGDLSEKELIKSAEGICASEKNILEKIKHLFEPFAKSYITVCKEGKGFFGLRDFYSLIKMVFSITKTSNECPTADQITGAVLRNFSGKDDVKVIDIFSRELLDHFSNTNTSTIDMVKESIFPACQMEENRYLLILTKNYAALQILQQIFLSHKVYPEIIFGSSFPKDQEYMQICRNINRVKVCMETGQTVVLLNLQNLYESLYDALNQYYVTLGGQKYVDLGLGTHRVKCRVHPNFRLIVIEEKQVVYEQFPIPLINRLEKHILDINTVLKKGQRDIADQLHKWVNDFISIEHQYSTSKKYFPEDAFIGYHSDTCSSLVLQVTENKDETDDQVTLKKAKTVMLKCATPDSVIRLDKSELPDDERDCWMKEYVKEDMHRSLGDYVVYHIKQSEHSQVSFTEVTTFSRLLTAADAEQLQNEIKCDAVKLLFLLQFDTEYSFLKTIREFLGSTHVNKVLLVQTEFDDDFQRKNILSSAKYSCINEINKCLTTDDTKTFVYFVTKLPRMEGGTSYKGFQGGPWRSVHIDDLRRSREFVSDVHSLKNRSIGDFFEEPPEAMQTEDPFGMPQNDNFVLGEAFDTTSLVRSCVQTAVGMLRDVVDSGELSTRRVENLLTLLEDSAFVKLVRKHLYALLKEYEANILSPKNWVLNQASNVSALQEGGTFLHTLWRKVQTVVTPLLANLVSVIDRDCNLDLLVDEGQDIRELWFEIFGSKEMLNVPYVTEIK